MTDVNARLIQEIEQLKRRIERQETKEWAVPRMTTAERDAVSSPTEGMVIFNTTTHVLNYYYGSWQAV